MSKFTQKQKDRQRKELKSIVSNISIAIVELISIRSEIESAIATPSSGRYCGHLQRANSELQELMRETLLEARASIVAELHAFGAAPYNN